MSFDESEYRGRIRRQIADASIAFDGDGCSCRVQVVSASFAGMPRLKRHRLVYKALEGDLADGSLHALSIQTLTPEEAAELG